MSCELELWCIAEAKIAIPPASPRPHPTIDIETAVAVASWAPVPAQRFSLSFLTPSKELAALAADGLQMAIKR